jgi:hypothetical protein
MEAALEAFRVARAQVVASNNSTEVGMHMALYYFTWAVGG